MIHAGAEKKMFTNIGKVKLITPEKRLNTIWERAEKNPCKEFKILFFS